MNMNVKNGRIWNAPLQKSTTFCSPYLPLVVASRRVLHKKTQLSFSTIRLEERHGKGGPGRNVRASFLATSWDAPRSGINKTNRERAQLCEPVGEDV